MTMPLSSSDFLRKYVYFGEWNDVPMLSSLFWYHPQTFRVLHEVFDTEPGAAFFTIQRKQYLYVSQAWMKELEATVGTTDPRELLQALQTFSPRFAETKRELFALHTKHTSPATLSSDELANLYETVLGHVHVMAGYDLYCMFAEPAYLAQFDHWLKERLRQQDRLQDFDRLRAILTSPTEATSTLQEERSLLLLARRLREGVEATELEQMITMHVDRYGWIPVYLSGKAWDRDYVLTHANARKDNPTLDARLSTLDAYSRTIKQQIADILAELNDSQALWPALMQAMAFARNESETVPSFVTFFLRPFYPEMASRLGVSVDQFFFFTPEEILAALRGASLPSIEGRREAALNICDRQSLHTPAGEDVQALFSAAYQPPQTSETHDNALQGSCASPGTCTGIVRIVQSVADEERFQKGDILVSESTCIDYVPIMRLAGAIVTELGGITSHAAIVSRELSIPCLVGVKGATRLLKDGERVVVCANERKIVYYDGNSRNEVTA